MNTVYLYPAAIKNWFKKIVNEDDSSVAFDRATWQAAAKENGHKLKFYKTEEAARLAFRTTKVVFRTFKSEDKEVIAVFPEEDEGNGNVSAYVIIGEHTAVDYNVVLSLSRPATPEEYAEIQKRLIGRGYILRVMKRHTR